MTWDGQTPQPDRLRVSQSSCAGKVDLVTETDKECEKIIFGSLKETFPDHVYIGEEDTAASGHAPELTDAPTWMIDPIDGVPLLTAACHIDLLCLHSLSHMKAPSAGANHATVKLYVVIQSFLQLLWCNRHL